MAYRPCTEVNPLPLLKFYVFLITYADSSLMSLCAIKQRRISGSPVLILTAGSLLPVSTTLL